MDAKDMFEIVLFVIAVFAYFTPAIVANNRYHNNTTAIIFLNLLLGWLVIPWAIALVWALTNPVQVQFVEAEE